VTQKTYPYVKHKFLLPILNKFLKRVRLIKLIRMKKRQTTNTFLENKKQRRINKRKED